MSIPIQDFWALAVESRLFTPEQCQRLAGQFGQMRGAADAGNTRTLCEWLITQGALTRYQSKVLLARRPGPFIYGDYQVQERIDSGRLEGVFRAIHLPTRHPVCLYFLSGAQLGDGQALARMRQIIAAAATVRHPHVARVYHLVDLDAYKFAVLADLQGRSLEEWLAARGKYPPTEACRIARQAALGLSELHKSGQIHGEVRPANLWLDGSGHVRLLQLPVSRDPLAPPTTAATAGADANGALKAAADYLAPELLAAGAMPQPPSDLYSLGCVLYQMLTGRPPFAEGDVHSKLRRHAQEQPPLASQVNPQVPQPIAQVVAYLLAKDPAARYQQGAHVAEALAPYVEPAAREAAPPSPTTAERAYEEWLGRQQPPPQRYPAAGVPLPPTPAAAPPLPARPAVASAVPMAAPVAGMAVPVGHAAPVSAPYAAVPTGAPVAMAAPAQAVAAAQPAAAPAAPVVPNITTAPAPSVAVSETHSALAAQRKQKQQAERRNKLIIGSGSGLLVLVVVLLVLFSRSGKPPEEVSQTKVPQQPTAPAVAPSTAATGTAATTPGQPAPAPAQAATAEEPLVAIDGEPLWDSPTSGKPLDMHYLPADAQMFVALRPAEIWAHAEGQQVLKALGIEAYVRSELTRLTGLAPEGLESVVLAYSGRGMATPPAVSAVARAKQAVDEASIKQNTGASEPLAVGDRTVLRGPERTVYLPPDAEGKLVISAPLTDEAQVSAWMAASQSPPPLPRQLETLARSSDRQRHLTVLAAPSFIYGEGRGTLLGTLAALMDRVQTSLMDETGEMPGGVMLSAHLSDHFFVEARLLGSPSAVPSDLARLYRTRIRELPDAVERFCASLDFSPYSRPVMYRYREFFRFADQYTRVGTSDKQVVLRTVLPPVAASNITFATHLAMVESGGAGAPLEQPSGPKTLAERLKQKYTLSFDRDSLDRTLNLISQDTGIPIKILGSDLQLEGITQNQSFGLDEKDKPIFEILKTIMLKANPDGKLIYVIQKIDGQETVVVTTRAAAAKRGDAIPPELK